MGLGKIGTDRVFWSVPFFLPLGIHGYFLIQC